jgi:hypothetical protein
MKTRPMIMARKGGRKKLTVIIIIIIIIFYHHYYFFSLDPSQLIFIVLLFALSNSWLNHANSFIITRFQTLHSISIIFLFFCFILILNLWIKSTNSIMLMPNTDLWSNVLFACQISNCISFFSICAWIRCMIC